MFISYEGYCDLLERTPGLQKVATARLRSKAVMDGSADSFGKSLISLNLIGWKVLKFIAYY